MRGTQTVVLSTSSSPGIIPAYAGNTLKMCCRIMMTRDHPRVCGEHTRKAYRNTISSGSSPRMRGTPGRFHNLRDETGIIPAYAGNTYATVNVQVAVWDHPRVCGEHAAEYLGVSDKQGSSPRMRGTLVVPVCGLACVGIIPAYAGNTSTQSETPRHRRDHPRVCGEHSNWIFNCVVLAGSSPRMRGTQRHAVAL